MVPLRFNPATGTRTPVVPPPVGFHPTVGDGASESPNFLMWLAGLLCRHPDEPHVDPTAVLATRTATPVPPTRNRFSPIDIRQPDFDSDAVDDAHGSVRLSSKTLSTLKSKLDLPDISDYIIDLTAACGRRAPDAHLLLVSPDWHAHLAGGHPTMVNANKRIAEYINASIDKDGSNVKRLMSKLRKAETTDRPGILFSGMDILEEIAALITERSIGEIKLSALSTKPTLNAGATVDQTRLTADEIQKNFVLKTESERAIPNALFHEILSYMPESDPTLTLKKQEYQSKLYKAEMHKKSVPWTLDELIDEIAVDLARASPAKEASGASRPSDRPPAELTPTYRCASCGATGQHLSKDCTKKCPKCNFNFCPGNRSMLCAVQCVEQPSTRSLKNFFDRDLHPYLVSKLDKAWAAKHGKQIKEVSSAELTDTIIYDDDEDENELCSTVGPIGLCNPRN